MKKIRELISRLKELSSKKIKLIVVGTIILSNTLFYLASGYIDFSTIQKRTDASGFSHGKAQHFAYFHYYKNLFPLATLDSNITYSEAGADDLIHNHGENLIMEYQHWSRLGENARIFAYYPNSLLKGSPENPSIKLFNVLVFTCCLILCFNGFSKANRPRLGLIIVLILLLTPYFKHEIFQNENIFGILIPLFFTLIGLNARFIFLEKHKVSNILWLPLISGVLIGFFSEMRGEIFIITGSLILLYLFSRSLLFIGKLLTILILLASLFTVKKSIKTYFNNKFEETYALVKEKGGHTYDGIRIDGHRFWHPVFCGLGDFDNQFGYEWNDRNAYAYALPLLKEQYNLDFSYSGLLHPDNYYDKDSLYYVKFDDILAYELIVQEKVVNDIKNNPIWYATILLKRINRVLIETLPFHWIGWLSLPFVFILFKRKKWNTLKLILIGLPLSFTPIFIYSGGNSTHNSVFGIMILVFIIDALIKRFWKASFEIPEEAPTSLK